MKQKIAIIIGAGPAGLTAAYELLDKTDIVPVVVEATPDIWRHLQNGRAPWE